MKTPNQTPLASAGFFQLWKVTDVMRALGLSRTWVYEHAASGELPSLRLGGSLRFDPEAVRAYAFKPRRGPAIIPFQKGGE